DQIAVLAPVEEQTFRLGAVKRRDPNAAILRVCELSARGNHRLIAVIYFYGRSRIERQDPNRGGWLLRRGTRIGREIPLRGPVGIVIAAQHKDQPRPIRRERQLGYLLTVIIFERCDF